MDSGPGDPSREDLRSEIGELRQRVDALERLLRVSNGALPQPAETGSVQMPATSGETLAPDSSSLPERERPGGPSQLESRIGAQIFNRVGIFAVLAGAAWFLKLAIDRAWIGPGLRVALGLLIAIALPIWSERFRRDGAVAFSYTLKALGAGIAYLSLWAAFNLYHLFSASVSFAAMVAVTVTIAALAWRQDSELLAVLALAGGFATPALLSTGQSEEIFLFTYLLLLDVGALVLMVIRPWPRLAIGAFAGTTAYFGTWWWSQDQATVNEPATGVFIALFFSVFTVAPLLGWRRRAPSLPSASGVDGLLAALPVAAGMAALAEGAALIRASSPASSIAWIAAALGLVSLALVCLLPLWPAAPEPAQSERFAAGLRAVHLGLVIFFFALAGLLRFHGHDIAFYWVVELALLAAIAARLHRYSLARPLRRCTGAMLLLAFCGMLALGEQREPFGTPAFANSQFAISLAALAGFAIVAALSRRMLRLDVGANGPAARRQLELDSWLFLAGFSIIAFNIVALASVGLQIDLYWHDQLRLAGRNLRSFRHPAYVDFTYSAWFMLYGAALMAAGFLRRSAFLRWQALILLSLSIAKVFLFDISHLNEGYRVLSFLGLGILLLAISFAYQRDWLALRGQRS